MGTVKPLFKSEYHFNFPSLIPSKYFSMVMQISTLSSAALWCQPTLYRWQNFKAVFLRCGALSFWLIPSYTLTEVTNYTLYCVFPDGSRNSGNNYSAEVLSLMSFMRAPLTSHPNIFSVLQTSCLQGCGSCLASGEATAQHLSNHDVSWCSNSIGTT